MNKTSKIVFLTGCGSGIGKHLAQSFYKRGYKVIATDIDVQKLDYTSHWDKDRKLIAKLDVTQISDWKNAIDLLKNKWNDLDIMINNAGILVTDYFYDIKNIKDIDNQIDINLKGTIYGTHFILPFLLKKQDGIIINISSLAGVAPIPGMSIYSASKYGVRGFTLAIAPELAGKGIKVYNISPDAVNTPLVDGVKHKKASNLLFSGVLLSPQDIEKVVFKLLKKPARREILLPWWRAVLARFGNCFPYISSAMAGWLDKYGNKKRKKYQNQTN